MELNSAFLRLNRTQLTDKDRVGCEEHRSIVFRPLDGHIGILTSELQDYHWFTMSMTSVEKLRGAPVG